MNYYAQAIEIITSNRTDWFEIVGKIAAKNPKAVVDAVHGDWQKEAKAVVDVVHRDWKKEAKELVDGGQKIAAIKLCRALTGYNLQDAKKAVESLSD